MGLPSLCSHVPCTRIQGFEPTSSAWSGTVITPLARLAPLLGFSLSRVFLSLTLCQISLVTPFTLLAVPLRPWLESQGIHRWANRLFPARFLVSFDVFTFLDPFSAHCPPLLATQSLPPEFCALMQLPVPQWLSRLFTGFQHGYGPRCRSLCRYGAERVTASLSTARFLFFADLAICALRFRCCFSSILRISAPRLSVWNSRLSV